MSVCLLFMYIFLNISIQRYEDIHKRKTKTNYQGFWNESIMVYHYALVPKTLVLGFHCLDVLVKTFSLLVPNCSKIFWKTIHMIMQEMKFQGHSTPKLIKGVNKFLDSIFEQRRLIFSKRILKICSVL